MNPREWGAYIGLRKKRGFNPVNRIEAFLAITFGERVDSPPGTYVYQWRGKCYAGAVDRKEPK